MPEHRLPSLAHRSEGANSKVEVLDALGGMTRQTGQYVCERGLGIDVVELGGSDDGVDGRGAPAGRT